MCDISNYSGFYYIHMLGLTEYEYNFDAKEIKNTLLKIPIFKNVPITIIEYIIELSGTESKIDNLDHLFLGHNIKSLLISANIDNENQIDIIIDNFKVDEKNYNFENFEIIMEDNDLNNSNNSNNSNLDKDSFLSSTTTLDSNSNNFISMSSSSTSLSSKSTTNSYDNKRIMEIFANCNMKILFGCDKEKTDKKDVKLKESESVNLCDVNFSIISVDNELLMNIYRYVDDYIFDELKIRNIWKINEHPFNKINNEMISKYLLNVRSKYI